MPRNVKFSEYSNEQIRLLDALLKENSTLLLSCQFLNANQQTVSFPREQLEHFNITSHLDWSLTKLKFDLPHAAFFISLYFQDDLKQIIEEHRPPRKPILSFKNLVILLISLCLLSISFYLFNQAQKWLVFIILQLVF